MEVELLLWCIVAPLLISSGACFLVSSLNSQTADIEAPASFSMIVVTMLVPLGWTLAVAIALWKRQQIGWWPEEAWQQIIFPIAAVGILIAVCSIKVARLREWQWLLAGIGVFVMTMTAMPSGQAWSDMLHLHRSWMMLVGIACLANAFALQGMSESSAERWVALVALAGLAGPALLAASAYGGLAEWFVAACSATLGFAFFSAIWPGYRIWTAVFPATLFAAAGTASGRFYTFEEHPLWLYILMLFLPTVVAIVDLPARKLSGLFRLAIAAITAIAMLLAIAWFLFSGQEAEW